MKNARQAARGFSLVEVALATGIAAFCLVVVFGLFPVGLNSNQNTIDQTAAANMASMVMTDLQATPKGYTTASPRFNVPAPTQPSGSSAVSTSHTFFLRDDGTATGAPDVDANGTDNPKYRVTVSYNVPAANQAYFSVPIRILVTWPAMADRTASTPPAHFSGSFELNGSFVRN